MTGPGPEDDDPGGLAAEYVLGLLDGEERAACDARLRDDPAFREAVLGWTERLAAIAEAEVPGVAPPPAMLPVIEGRLFRDPLSEGIEPPPGRPWWRRLGLRQALVGAAAAAAIVWYVSDLGLIEGPGPSFAPTLQAELASEEGGLSIRAAIDVRTGTVAISRDSGAPRPGRALQLWLIAGDAPPVSLGVLPEDRLARFDLPQDVPLDAAALAVSDEPPGGSPTGAPTGDVLAVGAVSEL